MLGQRRPIHRAARLCLQRLGRRPATTRRRRLVGLRATAGRIPRSGLLGAFAGTRRLRRRQIDPRSSGLREPDGNGLFARACAVLSLTHVIDFLTHELPRLGRGGFALGLVFSSALDGSFFRHGVAKAAFVMPTRNDQRFAPARSTDHLRAPGRTPLPGRGRVVFCQTRGVRDATLELPAVVTHLRTRAARRRPKVTPFNSASRRRRASAARQTTATDCTNRHLPGSSGVGLQSTESTRY